MKSTYIVTPNYPPDICGIGDYSSFLFKNLLENNADIHIITFSDEEQISSNVHFIKKFEKRQIISWLNCLKDQQDVITILIQYEPYSFSKIGIPFYLIYICLILKIKGYKLSIMFHEVATRLYIANPKKIVISLIQLFIAYFITALSSIRATSTSFNAKQLRPFKFTLIPIPSNFINRKPNINNVNNNLIIGCFANRVDEFFASVIDQILQKNIGVIYLIGKQNKANNEIWKNYDFFNRENLIITGTLKPEGIEECFDEINMFLHLEKIDTQGRGGASLKNGSLAAALNWGLPVITSKGDMTDENFLHNNENIFFVNDPYSVNSWVEAVQYLNDNKNLKSQIQKNAFDFYEHNLSWSVVTKKYLFLINNI